MTKINITRQMTGRDFEIEDFQTLFAGLDPKAVKVNIRVNMADRFGSDTYTVTVNEKPKEATEENGATR